ncbi:MAG: DUF4157 domain-containing protein, partial [Bacteroidota bacterium]|nr:DUF4157 domain-containing protein [Bacteroidota bacterium]
KSIQKQDDVSASEAVGQEMTPDASESVTSADELSNTAGNLTDTQSRFLADDSAAPGAGQMNKSDFLEQLNVQVCNTVDEALAGTSYSSNNCPYIRAALARLQGNSPSQIEQILQRYEPATRSAQSAWDIIQIIQIRVQSAVTRWKENGNISGIPADIVAQIPAGLQMNSGLQQGSDSGTGNLLFKSVHGADAHPTQSPASVMQSLGKGRTIEGSTRSKMESAFGTNFSGVQIHTDSRAANLSGGMNARAFSVGNHIAFANGEHQPGTLIGDALLAHELAHVAQQQGAGTSDLQSKDGASYNQLEADADSSAVNAVMSLRGLRGNIKEIKKQMMPRLKSKLQLQRCPGNSVKDGVARYKPFTSTAFENTKHAACKTDDNTIGESCPILGKLDGKFPPGRELEWKGGKIINDKGLPQDPCAVSGTRDCGQ